MKVSTSVWVAALASWICVGVAHAEGAAAVVATPAVVAVPVAAVAATPVVVPTQEVAAEAAPTEAPATVVAPAVIAPALVAPAAAEPVVVPVVQSPVVPTTATAEPAAAVSAVAPPPVVVPVAAPAAPAPAPHETLADPFATPAAAPLWSTSGTQPTGVSTSSAGSTEALPISPQSPYEPHHHARRAEDYRLGVGMMFGGGITDFESQSVREMTGTGGAWDVRLIFGQREVLALETAYVGSAHYISAAGLDNDAMLVSNGAEGALRLNIPIIDHGSIIEPFGFVGLGWSRYELTQTAYNRSNLTTAENVMEVPYGAGLTMGSDGFLVDIRFTYRSTYYDQLMRVPSSSSSTSGDSQRLNSWSLGAHIGFEF
jgi:hypothetical protein